MRCSDCGGHLNYRRNADESLRRSEREHIAGAPTVENLLRLHHQRYRSGLPGVARPKLETWWEEAMPPNSIIERGRPNTPDRWRDPVHPYFLAKPQLDVLHGYFDRLEVKVRHYFDRPWLHGPMNTIMSIIVATGRGGGEFPSGYKVRAYLLDSDTLAMHSPEIHENRFTHQSWSPEELEINNFKSLSEILTYMAEQLFLYEHSEDLISRARRECPNCMNRREAYTSFGHHYYHCVFCLGPPRY